MSSFDCAIIIMRSIVLAETRNNFHKKEVGRRLVYICGVYLQLFVIKFLASIVPNKGFVRSNFGLLIHLHGLHFRRCANSNLGLKENSHSGAGKAMQCFPIISLPKHELPRPHRFLKPGEASYLKNSTSS